MRNCTRYVAALVLAASAVFAQDIAQDIGGDWQGTVKTGSQESGRYRYLLHIAKEKDGWGGTVRTIDQRIDWGGVRPVGSVSLQGSDLKFSVEDPHGSYDGKVSPDWTSITGTWKQGPPQQLEFLRPTKDTEWRDDPRHGVQFIEVDRNVIRLEVLDWGGSGRPLVLLTGLGNSAHIFDQFALKLTAD